MFDLDVNGLSIVARTLIVYLALLAGLRLAGKRELGQMTPFDLVVILLIANAVQNAMVGPDTSVRTSGLPCWRRTGRSASCPLMPGRCALAGTCGSPRRGPEERTGAQAGHEAAVRRRRR